MQKLLKSSHGSYDLKIDNLIIAQIVYKYLGYFCKKICLEELSKLAQFGHTVTATESRADDKQSPTKGPP